MEKIYESFGNVSTKTRSLEYNLCTIEKVTDALLEFYKILTKSSEIHKNSLWTTHHSELDRIRIILKKYVIGNKQLNSIYDKVFTNIFTSRQSHTTLLFTKFIKGITYFKNEHYTDDTVYHRIQSCGSYKDERSCINSVEEKDTLKHQRIYICYLERLIWDYIFKYENPNIPGTFDESIKQDKSHEDRLNITQKEYQSCYKDCDLEVIIEFNPEPYKLIIKQLYKTRVKCIEIYTRNVMHDIFGSWEYEMVVECKRKYKNIDYAKFQTFYNKSKWIPLSKSAKARSLLSIKTDDHKEIK